MQSLTVGEPEVEIIPPKFRNFPGRRGSMSGLRADYRQTVNLTRMESFSMFDRTSTYNASGENATIRQTKGICRLAVAVDVLGYGQILSQA